MIVCTWGIRFYYLYGTVYIYNSVHIYGGDDYLYLGDGILYVLCIYAYLEKFCQKDDKSLKSLSFK